MNEEKVSEQYMYSVPAYKKYTIWQLCLGAVGAVILLMSLFFAVH